MVNNLTQFLIENDWSAMWEIIYKGIKYWKPRIELTQHGPQTSVWTKEKGKVERFLTQVG